MQKAINNATATNNHQEDEFTDGFYSSSSTESQVNDSEKNEVLQKAKPENIRKIPDS